MLRSKRPLKATSSDVVDESMLLLSRLQVAALCDSEFFEKIRQFLEEKQYQYHEENCKMKPGENSLKKNTFYYLTEFLREF